MSPFHLVPLMVFHKNLFLYALSLFLYVYTYIYMYMNIIYQVCHFALVIKVINPFFAHKMLLGVCVLTKHKIKKPSELRCPNITCWLFNFTMLAAYLSVSVNRGLCFQFSGLLNSCALSLTYSNYFLLLYTIRNQEQMCKQNTIISSNMRTNESQIQ